VRLRRLAAAALLAHLAAPLPAANTPTPDLAVAAPAFTFSKSSITVEVSLNGALAGRRLSVIAFVDRNMIRTFPAEGSRTRLVIDGLELAPGSHEILIKSGTYEARDGFRYVPVAYPATAAAAFAVIVTAVVLRRRRSA